MLVVAGTWLLAFNITRFHFGATGTPKPVLTGYMIAAVVVLVGLGLTAMKRPPHQKGDHEA